MTFLRLPSVQRVWIMIDLDELRSEIRGMSVRSKLYKLLKEELSVRGWWKNRARGKPGLHFSHANSKKRREN